MPSFALLYTVVLFSVSTLQVLGSCACGYEDSNGNLWRESIVSTFTQDAGALAAVNADWIIATDLEVQSSPATANIQYVTANVYEYQDALGLKASAYDHSGSVKCAEIFTNRDDILYGTFRMQAQVPSVPGVAFGFFTYHNDSQEQDIEFLSSEPEYSQHVHYTNQPGSDPGATEDVNIPGADFTTFGIHRFDWLPSETVYSYAGTSDSGTTSGTPITSSTTITVNVPDAPSEFVLNVWSNGDPGWSYGPPIADAIATVHYVNLYFNSTSLSASSFHTTCSQAGNIPACSV
ncbi:concanavalin A-like lectin/glucanase domain-containing protein [Mycena galopus ATCC 62051]|nr:concanavalin A-like lectin/glucanase domain-containing protein [Mycena galopus ATCC 62051]